MDISKIPTIIYQITFYFSYQHCFIIRFICDGFVSFFNESSKIFKLSRHDSSLSERGKLDPMDCNVKFLKYMCTHTSKWRKNVRACTNTNKIPCVKNKFIFNSEHLLSDIRGQRYLHLSCILFVVLWYVILVDFLAV